MTAPRIGFFTRLLETAPPAERYRFALEQIEQAERSGFASAWVAQHHFNEDEGGLPSPFALLSAASQRTERIALATGIVTLPLDDAVRVAEDAAVADALSGGRLQLGVGTGGTPSSFTAFGLRSEERREIFADRMAVLRDALNGLGIRGTQERLYPSATTLGRRIWQATFSIDGGVRAGVAGDGLLLSRTQPRPVGDPLHSVQVPVVQAYLDALPPDAAPRILASRTALVVDPRDRAEALERAERGLRRLALDFLRLEPADVAALDILQLARLTDTHVGTVDEVVESLSEDATLATATDVAFQVHSIDAGHELTLRSIELLAEEVAPRLGLRTGAADELRGGHSDQPVPTAAPLPEGVSA